jgi:transposase-like protein
MSKKVKQSVSGASGSQPSPALPSLPGARDGFASKERRLSAQKKAHAAQRLLRGEAIDALSRELGVTAATLSNWRDKFLAAGEAALKSREPTAQDDEILRLKAKIGGMAPRPKDHGARRERRDND